MLTDELPESAANQLRGKKALYHASSGLGDSGFEQFSTFMLSTLSVLAIGPTFGMQLRTRFTCSVPKSSGRKTWVWGCSALWLPQCGSMAGPSVGLGDADGGAGQEGFGRKG